MAELHQQIQGRSTWKSILGSIAVPGHIRWTDKLVLVKTSPCIYLHSVNSFGLVKLLFWGALLCARGKCPEDPRMAGHHMRLHRIHWFGFTELIVRCALHGFLGQSQHNRFISPPGWFTQALGLISGLYKVYQVPGFQRVRRYFDWRVWSHKSQVLKNFPGFCHFAHVCSVSGCV